MAVLYRPTSSAAIHLKGFATKMGNAMLANPGTAAVQYKMLSGFILKAVRVDKQTVIVTALDMPTLICVADWYNFEFAGPQPYFTFTVPGGRDLFYKETASIIYTDVGDLETFERRVAGYISYGPKVGDAINGPNLIKSRGIFTSSDYGVVCSRLDHRSDVFDFTKDVITVQRASAAMWWFPDDVTTEEINDRTIGKALTLQRIGYIDFPRTMMSFWSGDRVYDGYANICIENSVCELRADDGMVCAHTFFDWVGLDKCAGVLIWRYHTFYIDEMPPGVEPFWGTQVDLTMLPDSLLKPTRDLDGYQLRNAIVTTLPAYTETRGMVAMYTEALHRVGINYYTGRGLVVLDINVDNGDIVARIADEHTFADETFVYLYTQVFGMNIQVSEEPVVWEPRIISTRTKWNQFIDIVGFPTDSGVYPHAEDLDITIASPDGGLIAVTIPGHWPRAHIISNIPDDDGGYPIGTYMHLNTQLPESNVGEAYYAQPVCQYADDIIAVVCSPNDSFGNPSTPISIALVQVSTGMVIDVRSTGFAGYMYHNFGITCPRRAEGSFIDGEWVETQPATLMMDVRRFDGPGGAPPEYPQTDNGMWMSTTGGTFMTHVFGYRGVMSYYLGSQFADTPMRSADLVPFQKPTS